MRKLDRDADPLTTGTKTTDPDLGRLVSFADDVRQAYTSSPESALRTAHLAAMAVTYQEDSQAKALAQSLDDGVSTNGHKAPKRAHPRLLVRGGIAAVAFVLLGTTALAATGSLPGRAQNAVSRVAKFVGVDIPRTDGKRVTITQERNPSSGGSKRKAERPETELSKSDPSCLEDDSCVTAKKRSKPRRSRGSSDAPEAPLASPEPSELPADNVDGSPIPRDDPEPSTTPEPTETPAATDGADRDAPASEQPVTGEPDGGSGRDEPTGRDDPSGSDTEPSSPAP